LTDSKGIWPVKPVAVPSCSLLGPGLARVMSNNIATTRFRLQSTTGCYDFRWIDIYVKMASKLLWMCPHQRYLWSTSCQKMAATKINI